MTESSALRPDGKPDFPLVCEAMLHRNRSILLTFRLHEPYLAGEYEGKNRNYWRYELEREGAIRSRQRRVGESGVYAARSGLACTGIRGRPRAWVDA